MNKERVYFFGFPATHPQEVLCELAEDLVACGALDSSSSSGGDGCERYLLDQVERSPLSLAGRADGRNVTMASCIDDSFAELVWPE